MAYLTGVPATMTQFMQAIVACAQTAGWILDANPTGEACLHSVQGDYFSMRVSQGSSDNSGGTPTYIAAGQGIYLYMNSGFTSSQPAYKQPSPGFAWPAHGHWFSPRAGGPYVRYHIFADATYVHAVLEVQAKVFAHLQIGRLNKKGINYNGGQYLAKTLWNANFNTNNSGILSGSNANIWGMVGHNSTDGNNFAGASQLQPATGTAAFFDVVAIEGFEGRAGRWLFPAASINDPSDLAISSPAFVAMGSAHISSHPDVGALMSSANQQTGDTLLVPSRIFMRGAQHRLYPIGEVPDFAWLDMEFVAPGESLFFGTEEWMAFPNVSYNATDYQMLSSSGRYGMAYKVKR